MGNARRGCDKVVQGKPNTTEDGLLPHKVREVWLFASTIATQYVDITNGMERKLAARLAHESQTPHPSALRANWTARTAEIGAPVWLAAAEAFTVLRLS
ncbi:hypothetical protein BH24ACT15_BH24ACT15_34530 [soil metagenome]|jgi:LmbE family N-acetylglucosaminyl deacetylase|nr:hypothetical protein [Chloroflexota bacterium]